MSSWECSEKGHYTKGTDEVLKELGSSMDGLSTEEASDRSSRIGPNEIPKVRRSFLRRVAPQIFDFVILLLIGIAVVLAVLAFIFPDNESTSFETSIVILSVIMLSWIMIVIQMFSAERSLESLRKISSARARVKRDGKWKEVPTSELVPGDIVRLGEGDRVPADTRVIKSDHLSLDESSLTGESISVEKDPEPVNGDINSLHEISNTAFMSTIVAKGSCEGVVVCTGLRTELGKIAKGIQEAPEPAIPLQKKMSQLGRTLSIIMLVLITFLLIFQVLRSLLRGELTMELFIEELINAVILGVVAVPWSFPIITTSVMAR